MAIWGVSSLEACIAEARSMQESGRYINGTVFHAMAEAIAENRQTIAALVAALEAAECKMVSLYRTTTPFANDDLGGPGNRFADKDEDVIAVRAALALARKGG